MMPDAIPIRRVRPPQRGTQMAQATMLREIRDQMVDAADGAACHYCGRGLVVGGDRLSRPSLDHVEPTSRGGTNARANLVLACHRCNCAKGNRTIEEARHSLTLVALDWPLFTRAQIDWLRRRGLDLSEYDNHSLWFERDLKE